MKRYPGMEGGLKFSFVIHLSAGQEVINNLQRINFSHLLCIPDICHGHKDGVRGEKVCHVEKFQISVHDR